MSPETNSGAEALAAVTTALPFDPAGLPPDQVQTFGFNLLSLVANRASPEAAQALFDTVTVPTPPYSAERLKQEDACKLLVSRLTKAPQKRAPRGG